MINLCLKEGLRSALGFVFSLFLIFPAAAQDRPPAAAPVETVAARPLPPAAQSGVTIIELFSSQACVFCPQADRLFADLIQQDGIIGLACHVDYFDVKTGSLSQSFCTERQSWYMDTLAAGPNYTPQMVINGRYDVMGYKTERVTAALRRAKTATVVPLTITPETTTSFQIALPDQPAADPERHTLWLAVYDRPHDIIIAAGLNRGRPMRYERIVSALGHSQEISRTVSVNPPLESHHGGFVVILQDRDTGAILAAGDYKL